MDRISEQEVGHKPKVKRLWDIPFRDGTDCSSYLQGSCAVLDCSCATVLGLGAHTSELTGTIYLKDCNSLLRSSTLV